LPHVCTSIALTIKRRIIVGVVYNPILDELYHATHSGPALLNGAPLAVSSVRELHSACLAAEFGSDRAPAKVELMLANTSAILRNSAQCLRSFGSCALDMCYVAAGRLDVYCEHGPYSWDMAAGALIVERAGGVVRDATGGPLSLTGRSLLVCNDYLLDQIRELYTPPVSHVMPS
jgi:fructose-1,6-bisphosphatase/inositol monophosphatase family enzyme